MAPNKEYQKEQWYVIKHCARSETAYQVYKIVKGMYGDNALGCSTVYHWHDTFVKEGRTSAKLKGGPDKPTGKLMEARYIY